MKTVFLAGATGAVGSALVPMLRAEGFRALPHVRPKTAERHPLGHDADALVFELADAARLDAAMRGADAVVCSVGTMRVRFRAGDTYESSDYRPVVELVESARRSGRRPFFLLVSALGARRGGGYLGWKHKAEEVVRASGLPNAILRPSFLDSTRAGSHPSDGKARKPPPIVSGALRLLGAIPPLRGISDDLRPLPVEVLCAAIVRILRDGAPAGLLHGRELWALSLRPAAAAPSAPRPS